MSKQEIVDYLMKPLGSFVGCSSYLQYPNLSHLVPESKPEKKGVNFIERLCFAKDVSGLWTNRAGSMQLISAFRAASFSNQDTSEARPRSWPSRSRKNRKRFFTKWRRCFHTGSNNRHIKRAFNVSLVFEAATIFSMPATERKCSDMLVHTTIQKVGQQSFADLCANITLQLTTFLGCRISHYFIDEKIVSETSVRLSLRVIFNQDCHPGGIKTSLLSHAKRESEGCSCFSIKVEKFKDTNDASGRQDVLPVNSAWRELHISIANDVSGWSKTTAGPFASENPFAILADPTPSGQSNARPMDVDDIQGIDAPVQFQSLRHCLLTIPCRLFCRSKQKTIELCS